MKKRIAIALVTVLGLYIASYLTFSVAGSYRVVAWGLKGPKFPRAWMPCVFKNRYDEMNMLAVNFYGPLYLLDRAVWHKDTWLPPPPPPFVQEQITIVPPVRYRSSEVTTQTEGTTTHIMIPFVDADGRWFTMLLIRSAHGRFSRNPIYITPDGGDSKTIVVANHATFFARVFEPMEDESEKDR